MEGNINDIKGLAFFSLTLLLYLFLTRRTMIKETHIKILFWLAITITFHAVFSFRPIWSLHESFKMITAFTLIIVLISRVKYQTLKKIVVVYFVAQSLFLIFTSDVLIFLGLTGNYEDGGHFYGLLTNSNMFGYSIFYGLPFFKYVVKGKYLLFVLVLNTAYLIVLSGSRGALAGFLLYHLIFYYNRYSIAKLGAVFTFLAALTVMFLDKDFLFKSGGSSINDIFGTRLHLWTARIDAISERPFLGWGYSVNEFTYFNRFVSTNLREKGNIVLAIFEEFGLVFGWIIMYLWLKLFRKSALSWKKAGNHEVFALTVVIVFFQMFETWLFNFNSLDTLVVWLFVIMGVTDLRKSVDTEETKKKVGETVINVQ